MKRNYYAEAITRIGEMGALEAEKMWNVLIEIAKTRPSVFVKAYDEVNPPAERCVGEKACQVYRDKEITGNYIKAIKECRAATGKGLKEAKDAVDGKCPAWN